MSVKQKLEIARILPHNGRGDHKTTRPKTKTFFSARKFEKTEADQFAGHGGTVIEKTE
jgi:hypothetical protein